MRTTSYATYSHTEYCNANSDITANYFKVEIGVKVKVEVEVARNGESAM